VKGRGEDPFFFSSYPVAYRREEEGKRVGITKSQAMAQKTEIIKEEKKGKKK